MGDAAHIDMIFTLLTRVWQQLEYCIDVCCVTHQHVDACVATT